MSRLFSRRGWTLADALLTAVVIGIISAFAYPAYRGVQENAAYSSAVSLVNSLNSAQTGFKSRNADYAAQWTAATSDQAKFTLLLPFIPMAPANLSQYAPTGYTFTFGATVDTRVTLTGPTPETSTY